MDAHSTVNAVEWGSLPPRTAKLQQKPKVKFRSHKWASITPMLIGICVKDTAKLRNAKV